MFICHCGLNIGGVVDVPSVVEYAKTLPGVAYAEGNLYTCASEGLTRIKEAIKKHGLNGVVVASCTPRTHEPLFRATCEEAGLNKYLFEMANIRDQCSWVHMHEPEAATKKAKDLIRMAVARARLLEPQEEVEIDVEKAALVIGGGVAGMTAALCLANQGFKTYIVEKEPEIGGVLRQLYTLYLVEVDAYKALDQVTSSTRKNENITILTSSTVKDIRGYIGNFEAVIHRKEGEEVELRVGTIIVATGAEELKPSGLYGYGVHENVVTQLELEQLLKEKRLKEPEKVVMIQCVGAREENGRTYCSRICCMVAIKNSILIKERYPKTDIYILYRDIQTYGEENEGLRWKALENGIKFIKYSSERPPQVMGNNGNLTVKVYHALLGEEIDIDGDLIVLSTPLVPPQSSIELSKMLKVSIDQNGFFAEAHVKLRPVDFATDGIYLCGTAHSPKTVAESIAQAYAAATRASIPMAAGKIRAEAITAVVEEKLCIGCKLCEMICPFKAIQVEETPRGRIARTIVASCKGCGLCGAACPERAITMRHFTDEQILAEIVALVEGK